MKTIIILIFSITLFSCGGGGGNSGDDTSATTTVNVTGTVTYTSYKADPTIGINYGTPVEKPIKGAVIELQNTSGTVLDSGNTTAAGTYSLTAPANASVRIVVKAALGNPTSPHTKVIDNTSSDALYALTINMITDTSNLSQSFNASSGWDGVNYSSTRSAAPFAILDVIYQAQQMVLAVDNSVLFPQLLVNWSINNKPADGDKTIGEIGTSHYIDGQLFILGAANNDTDEYDTHVIAHEWGHYFEDKFSRSDSFKGDHYSNDILDPTVAFGEGFGNALSGMVMDDPLYIDTNGISQATVALYINLEADSVLDTDAHVQGNLLDGFYAETSIQEVLYDLYDSGTYDDDAIGLGFTPIYNVLINGQKTTPAFTTIFSFLHYLKLANPASSAAITSLALAENIENGDKYEATAAPLYTTVNVDGSLITTDVDGYPLQTWEDYGLITASDFGNKLFNTLYFKFTATTAGCYSLEVTPTAGGDLIIVGVDSVFINQYMAGITETVAGTFALGEEGVFAVGSFGGAETFTVRLFLTSTAC